MQEVARVRKGNERGCGSRLGMDDVSIVSPSGSGIFVVTQQDVPVNASRRRDPDHGATEPARRLVQLLGGVVRHQLRERDTRCLGHATHLVQDLRHLPLRCLQVGADGADHSVPGAGAGATLSRRRDRCPEGFPHFCAHVMADLSGTAARLHQRDHCRVLLSSRDMAESVGALHALRRRQTPARSSRPGPPLQQSGGHHRSRVTGQ